MEYIYRTIFDFNEDEWKRFVWELSNSNRSFNLSYYDKYIDNLSYSCLIRLWNKISLITELKISEFCKYTNINKQNFSKWINKKRNLSYEIGEKTFRMFLKKGISYFSKENHKPILKYVSQLKVTEILKRKSPKLIIICDVDKSFNKIIELAESIDSSKYNNIYIIGFYQPTHYIPNLFPLQKYSFVSLIRSTTSYANGTEYSMCYFIGYIDSILDKTCSFLILTDIDLTILDIKNREIYNYPDYQVTFFVYQRFADFLNSKTKLFINTLLRQSKKLDNLTDFNKIFDEGCKQFPHFSNSDLWYSLIKNTS